MKIYNTMTRQKEELKPLKKDFVSVYACGPTVYNLIHLGNARQICVFDTLCKYLKYKGYNVKFIQNFTDVDDKIINRAIKENRTPLEVSEEMIKNYFTDAHGLNVDDADIHPKVTENMGIIIDLVSELIEKDFAYRAGGDVYFRTAKFSEYGKLSHMPLENLRAGASERISDNEFKEDPVDFTLWKSSKSGEPAWESPFGTGRPGWHIECSAMSSHYIGDTIDIHGGGSDLIFPHHENEIAQSECATGKPLAQIWMHNGMLNVNNEKMSKSKNNFFLVREVESVYGYEPIRLMMLSAHYRSQFNYSEEVIASAVNSLQRLKNCRETIARAIGAAQQGEKASTVVEEIAKKRKEQFISAMDDDLNTADGMAALFELVRDINTVAASENYTSADMKELQKLFDEIVYIFGILQKDCAAEIPDEICDLVEERKQARKDKSFILADEIRAKIQSLGYTVEETRQGTTVKKL